MDANKLNKIESSNRRINSDFKEKLEDAGLEVHYGKYDYWDCQEYVLIGAKRVWLVETYNTDNNGYGVCFRMKRDFLKELEDTINSEYTEIIEDERLEDKVFKELEKIK